MADTAEAIYWLNPEPRAYWNTGDSLMARMGAWCAEVYEVRNLRQLERFVEQLADHRLRPPARRVSPPVGPAVR